jgi:GAF domain-containing protein
MWERGTTGMNAPRSRLEQVLEARNRVLERIARGASLTEVLDILTRTSEEIMPGLLCSVLLLDQVTGRLHHGSAPSLPPAYMQAIDGMTPGPGLGSCGTAAHTGERVIVEDVFAHPYWAAHGDLARLGGIRACWSHPIMSASGRCLGTFAMYYRDVRHPGPFELDFIQISAHVAGVAIERSRAEAELERHRASLEELVRERTSELEQVNGALRQALADMKTLRGMLPICAHCHRVRDDTGYWAQIEAYVASHSEAIFTHGICPACADEIYPARRR